MLVMCQLIPVSMAVFGSMFYKKPPAKINSFFGYRTAMSMKNNQTWAFAHRYCGRIYRFAGFVLIAVTFAAMLFALGKNNQAAGNFGLTLLVVQMAALIIPIFFTESALRKNFYSDGTPKN